jgi:hypothetical protein
MTCNVGGIERPIRIAVGILVLGVVFLADLSTAATAILSLVGGIALGTGAIGFCPAWKLLGVNTCPAEPGEKL